MAGSSRGVARTKNGVESLLEQLKTCFLNLDNITEVHAPRSLSRFSKKDLKQIQENLDLWRDVVLSIWPEKSIDEILDGLESYSADVEKGLKIILEGLLDIQDWVSSQPESRFQNTGTSFDPPKKIISLKTICEGFTSEDKIVKLKISHESHELNLKQKMATQIPEIEHQPPVPHNLAKGGRRATTKLPPKSEGHLEPPRRADTMPPSLTRMENLHVSSSPRAAGLGSSNTSPMTQSSPDPASSHSVGNQPRSRPNPIACKAAKSKLYKIKHTCQYKFRAVGPLEIFPFLDIQQVLLQDNTARDTFLCGCQTCNDLTGKDKDDRDLDISSLTGKFATTFALLIYLNHAGLISFFQAHNIYLSDTPLVRDNLNFISQLNLDDNDCRMIIGEIISHQHQFYVKRFEVQYHSATLDRKDALPFVENKEEEGKGGYGTVYSFEFLPGYADVSYKPYGSKFARKIFQKANVRSGLKEFNTLLRIWRKPSHINDNRRQHIMEALAAYEHGDIFFIIFPFAESTLARYLREAESEARLTPSEIWRQMEGVSGGLAFLHQSNPSTNESDPDPEYPNAFHFDLKPENILIRNNVIMISDFGQSKFRKASLDDSNTGADNSRLFFSYGPPEHDFSSVKDDNKKSNYNYDIWSLGCIFSELITYHTDPDGHRAVSRYRDARREDDRIRNRNQWSTTFYQDKTRRKRSVDEQHRRLEGGISGRKLPGYSGSREPWLEEFAGNNFFLLINDMLSIITETQRPRAFEVQERLGAICEAAEKVAEDFEQRGYQHILPQPDVWELSMTEKLPCSVRPKIENKINCFYIEPDRSAKSKCVIQLPPLEHRRMTFALILQHKSGEMPYVLPVAVLHNSMERHTGVTIDYYDTGSLPEPVPGVEPMNTGSPTSYKITPYAQYGVETLKSYLSLEFMKPEDAFLVQWALTGQHVVSDFSAPVARCNIFLPGEIGEKLKRTLSRTPKLPVTIQDKILIQIWSNFDFGLSKSATSPSGMSAPRYQDFNDSSAIHVSILTPNKLHLFKADYIQTTVDNLSVSFTSKDSHFHYEIDLEPDKGKILANIPAPREYKKCDKVTIAFKNEHDINPFLTTLKFCQHGFMAVRDERKVAALGRNR